MKLIDFIECFDYSIEDIFVKIWLDPFISREIFAENNYEYELEFEGNITEIPIMLANCYMTHDCYIEDGIINIYISERDRSHQ